MRLKGTWGKRLFAATLGAVIVGAPLFTVHADEGAFDRHGEHRYDVRRGAYEKPGGSDTEVAPGRYADEERAREHREQHRDQESEKERRERHERREERERERRGEHQETERERRERHERREEHERERREEIDREENRDNEGPRQYKYDVRRGMYEQEGGSDTEVSRGMYEQPSEDGQRRGLQR